MKRYFQAGIVWISFDRGERKTLPNEGARYCPLIRMPKDEKYIDWSIDFICPDFTKSDNIVFQFLVDTAPSYLVRKNEKYVVFEGNKKVAEIRITDIVEQEE